MTSERNGKLTITFEGLDAETISVLIMISSMFTDDYDGFGEIQWDTLYAVLLRKIPDYLDNYDDIDFTNRVLTQLENISTAIISFGR